jgi:hypothetical protein
MTAFGYLVVAVFLPLFPASMLFNRLFARIGGASLRMALLLVWPQLGLLALALLAEPPPAWVVYWAVLTACFYAFRALALRDLGLWTAHMATSSWSLLWVVAMFVRDEKVLILQAVGLSVPFIILAWLVSRLEVVFGAAYAGTYGGGLAQTVPRLSLVLVLSLLAAVGTPLFPAFFTLLATLAQALPVVPAAALTILVVWLLWAWAGVRMQRGMVVGPAIVEPRPDLDIPASLAAGTALALLAVAGAISLGYLL